MEPGILSIFVDSEQEKLASRSTQLRTIRPVMLEFHVIDVDAEYARLQQYSITWVKDRTPQSYGNRSIYFRDPDNN